MRRMAMIIFSIWLHAINGNDNVLSVTLWHKLACEINERSFASSMHYFASTMFSERIHRVNMAKSNLRSIQFNSFLGIFHLFVQSVIFHVFFFAIAYIQRALIQSDYLFRIIIISRTKQLNHGYKTSIFTSFARRAQNNTIYLLTDCIEIDGVTSTRTLNFPGIIHIIESSRRILPHIQQFSSLVFRTRFVKYCGKVSFALSSRELCILDIHLWFSFIKFYWIKMAQILRAFGIGCDAAWKLFKHIQTIKKLLCILCSTKML